MVISFEHATFTILTYYIRIFTYYYKLSETELFAIRAVRKMCTIYISVRHEQCIYKNDCKYILFICIVYTVNCTRSVAPERPPPRTMTEPIRSFVRRRLMKRSHTRKERTYIYYIVRISNNIPESYYNVYTHLYAVYIGMYT